MLQYSFQVINDYDLNPITYMYAILQGPAKWELTRINHGRWPKTSVRKEIELDQNYENPAFINNIDSIFEYNGFCRASTHR